MAANPEQRLIEQILSARETWVELEPGKKVRLRRCVSLEPQCGQT